MFDISELHIEVSSRCVLKCPRCPRTELPELHTLNTDYSLAEFQSCFPPKTLEQIDRIVFCGDTGDPIYAREFYEIVRYIKQTKPTLILKIVTNGSYKSREWWRELKTVMNNWDSITFSVDGWDHDSNNLYRVNSDYASILEGVSEMVVSPVHVNWSTIIFSFNEDRISQIDQQARDLGVDSLQIVDSTKFGGSYEVDGVDPLKPTKTISDTVYNKNRIYFTGNREKQLAKKSVKNVWQKCLTPDVIPFISVTGEFYPCPWFNSGYMINTFLDQNRDVINVRKRNLIDVANDPLWDELWLNIQPICRYKCYDR